MRQILANTVQLNSYPNPTPCFQRIAKLYQIVVQECNTSSSIFGSQKDIEEQADAIIMYFGLNLEGKEW